MKKPFFLLPIIVFLFAFTCDNEPLEGNFGANNQTCQDATEISAEASLNFVGATDDNFEELCLALAAAIQNQINICGDDSGNLQAALDELECTVNSELCSNAITLATAAQTAFQNATDENYTQLCNAYATALQAQINACGDPDGELQTMIDDLGDCS